MKRQLFFTPFLIMCWFIGSFANNSLAATPILPISFPVTTMKGAVLDSVFVEKKPVMLIFWANWCVPCRKEVPQLNDLHQEFSRRVQMMGINEDEKLESGLAFIGRYRPQYPNIKDQNFEIASQLGVNSLPLVLVVSAAGQELYRSAEPPSKDELKQLLEEQT